MIDIGQIFYEEKAFFFNKLLVYRILINPKVKGYPPLFLICRGPFGSKDGGFAIALTFLQLNRLLMQNMPNDRRLVICEQLADFLIPCDRTGEIKLDKLFGGPVRFENLDLITHVHRFRSEPAGSEPVYYFQLADK